MCDSVLREWGFGGRGASSSHFFHHLPFSREVTRKGGRRRSLRIREEGQGKRWSFCLTFAHFPEKKSPWVHIAVTFSFLSGKSISHCGPARVIINNNLLFLYSLRDYFAIEYVASELQSLIVSFPTSPQPHTRPRS